ncbi:MAG TPA: restriction endonuclease subunit S, partial [Thermoanaerobaculia bacterium]
KFAATLNDDVLGEETPPDYQLEYVDIGDVDAAVGIIGTTPYRFADAPSRARRRVRHGDVIISTVRTYLQAIASIDHPPNNLIASTGFAVIRPITKILDRDFCRFALREPGFLAEVQMRSFGVSYPAINATEIGDIPISLPSLKEQRCIADYLDCETARIDALVSAKERVLELLAEKRRALITRAVTRGIDWKVALTDSTVEWLPEVPQHWARTKIRRLFRQTKRLGYPELPVLSVYRDFGVIERSSRDDNFNRVPEDLEKYQLVEVGDLVINKMKAWQGSLGISTLRGITSPDYVVFSPTHREHSEFLHHFLRNRMLTTVYRIMSNGIRTDQWRLEPDHFGGLDVFLPPRDEQRAIVQYVAAKISKLDTLVGVTKRTIVLLKEHRSALIAAAVTGQIEITERDADGISGHH